MFLHRLALALGGMTVDELKRRMSHAELAQWREYNLVEPFGFPRDEARYAMSISTQYTTSPNKYNDSAKKADTWLYKKPDLTPKTGDSLLAKFKNAFRLT